ncbi:unnamed protein product, partial [Closterium sp. NIES-53]
EREGTGASLTALLVPLSTSYPALIPIPQPHPTPCISHQSPSRRFIWEEMSYLSRWWVDATQEERQGLKGAGASLVSHLACTLTLLFSLQPFPSVTLTPTLAFHLPPVPLSALYLGGDVVSEPLVGGCHSGGGEAGDEGAGASLLSRLACTLTLLYSLQPFPSVTLTETLAFHLPPVPLSALYLGGDVVSEPLVGGCHRGGAAGDEGAGAVRTAGDSGGRMGDER